MLVFDRGRLLSFVGFVSNRAVRPIASLVLDGACRGRFGRLYVFLSIASVTGIKQKVSFKSVQKTYFCISTVYIFRCVSLHNHFVFLRFQSSQLHLLHLLVVSLLQQAVIVQFQQQVCQTLATTLFLIFDAIHSFYLIAQVLVQLLLGRVGIVAFALESLEAMLPNQSIQVE